MDDDGLFFKAWYDDIVAGLRMRGAVELGRANSGWAVRRLCQHAKQLSQGEAQRGSRSMMGDVEGVGARTRGASWS